MPHDSCGTGGVHKQDVKSFLLSACIQMKVAESLRAKSHCVVQYVQYGVTQSRVELELTIPLNDAVRNLYRVFLRKMHLFSSLPFSFSDCPETYSVDQAGFTLGALLASASQVLGVKHAQPPPGFIFIS